MSAAKRRSATAPAAAGTATHAVLRGRILAEHEQHRIADEAEQREGDQPDCQHHDHGLGETTKNECEHGGFYLRASALFFHSSHGRSSVPRLAALARRPSSSLRNSIGPSSCPACSWSRAFIWV